MDVNDINSRLKRVYLSIGAIDIKDHVNEVSFTLEQGNTSNSIAIHTHLGPTNKDELELRIENVLSALGRLKDHLKNKMTASGYNGQIVEDEVNNSLVLQLIADLDNENKHGYPLERSNRSKKKPLITNIRSAIRVYGSSSGSDFENQVLNDIENNTVTSGAKMRFDLETGEVSYRAADNTRLIISADVVDEDMNYLVDLDDMVQDAILKWEMFIVKYKLKTSLV